MPSDRWAGGARLRRIREEVRRAKGDVCHLCGYPITGQVSPDHDPPRSVLIASGVDDPDGLTYLWPSHLICNQWRKAKPLTDELREWIRRRYEKHEGLDPMPRSAPTSPRFERRRPTTFSRRGR